MVGITKIKLGFMILLTILGIINLLGVAQIIQNDASTETGISTYTEAELQEVFRDGYDQGSRDALNAIVEIYPDSTIVRIADSLAKERKN